MGSTVFPAAGGGVTQKVSEFTSTGTFVTPSNCSSVQVFLVAGGGGGGFAGQVDGSSRFAGGGGAGGEVIQRIISVTPGASYTVTIGAGGAGSTSGSAVGGTGGNTTFGSLATAIGGNGGASYQQSGTSSILVKGGGGYNATGSQAGGAAAGAGGPANFFLTNGSGSSQAGQSTINTTNSRGVAGGIATNGSTTTGQMMAGRGIDGYGNGGMGGYRSVSTYMAGYGQFQWSGTGYPGGYNDETGVSFAGVAASANTGDGGHGYMTSNTVPNANGYAGGSGYARIIYWS